MQELCFQPATIADIARMGRRFTHKKWRALVYQVAHFPSFVIKDRDRSLMLTGFHPMERDLVEIWFLARADFGCDPRKIMFVRILRARIASILPGHMLMVRVHDDIEKHQKFVALVGFEPTDDFLIGTRYRTWIRLPLCVGSTP